MASTEKMLPAGMTPGKDEIEKHQELYKDQSFSLIPSIESFDFTTLPEKYITAFCKRNPSYTGVGYEYPLDPVDERRDLSFINYDMARGDLQAAEQRFRREKTEAAYKALRTKFSATIGTWVCLGYVKKELEGTSELELKKAEEEEGRSRRSLGERAQDPREDLQA